MFLKQNTGVPHWVGTVGFGICAPATEYFGKAAMAVMIAPIPEDAFRTFNGVKSDVSAVVSNLQEWIGDTPPLIVTHADPRNQNVPEIIEDLSRETNGFLIGGLTASRGAHPQLAEDVAEGEVSGVMMSLEAVPVAAALTQGCSPIGEIHRITSCEQNILIEIDGKPALDVFKEDIGEILARDLSKVAGYILQRCLLVVPIQAITSCEILQVSTRNKVCWPSANTSSRATTSCSAGAIMTVLSKTCDVCSATCASGPAMRQSAEASITHVARVVPTNSARTVRSSL